MESLVVAIKYNVSQDWLFLHISHLFFHRKLEKPMIIILPVIPPCFYEIPACLSRGKGEELKSGVRPAGQTLDIWIKKKKKKGEMKTVRGNKSVRGWRWGSCGGTWILPSRQHVIGSMFKRIRQAEKHPWLVRQKRKAVEC